MKSMSFIQRFVISLDLHLILYVEKTPCIFGLGLIPPSPSGQ